MSVRSTEARLNKLYALLVKEECPPGYIIINLVNKDNYPGGTPFQIIEVNHGSGKPSRHIDPESDEGRRIIEEER